MIGCLLTGGWAKTYQYQRGWISRSTTAMFDVNDRELQGALTHYPSLVKSLISTEKERMTMTSVRPSTNPKNVQVGVIPTYLYNIGSHAPIQSSNTCTHCWVTTLTIGTLTFHHYYHYQMVRLLPWLALSLWSVPLTVISILITFIV